MTTSNSILLNGFKIKLSSSTITTYVQNILNNGEFETLKKTYPKWFLYCRDGIVYGLPKAPNYEKLFGEKVTLPCNECLWLIAARIADILPKIFSKHYILRYKPFTFLSLNKEIVSLISNQISGLPPEISKFKIIPKCELHTKLIEFQDGELSIGLFMDIWTRWTIEASLEELQQLGIDLKGLYVVRRATLPKQRRLVGKIESITAGIVNLSDSYDGIKAISTREVWLEGSKASFARCLKKLLKEKYYNFEKERQNQEASLFTGPAIEKLLKPMEGYLTKTSPMQLTEEFSCSITGVITATNDQIYKSFTSLPPIEYCFDPAKSKRSQYAWSGIEIYGPFSRDTFVKKSPKLLILCPDTVQGKTENFLRHFLDGVNTEKKSHYSAGFAKTFGLINVQLTLRRVPLLNNKQGGVAEIYKEQVEECLASLEENETFDAAIVVILDEHAYLPDNINPYLCSKAMLLMAGIPVQQIRVSTITQIPSILQYTLQNISIAMYAKMNGVPWTVNQDLTISDELVIGMGTCEISKSRFESRQKYIGITTVFRGDGNYLLSNLSKECTFDEYPDTLKKTTIDILKEIKKRNGWQPNDTVRVVFHSYKPLRNIEIDDIIANCVKIVGNEQNVEFAFLTIAQQHPFCLLDLTQQGIGNKDKKAIYVPERGMMVHLGKYTRLLSTNGPSLIKRANSPLPYPLLVHLHSCSTFRSLDYLTEQILKFTSLSWRSTLPASKPVTIYYSELIAEYLARLRNLPYWSPAMLNIKLRASRWFL